MSQRTPSVALTASVNPIDIDYRALLVTTGFAAVAWVLSSLPLVAFAWRANLLELLKAEGPWGSASRAAKRKCRYCEFCTELDNGLRRSLEVRGSAPEEEL
jgi:hypothetical protein